MSNIPFISFLFYNPSPALPSPPLPWSLPGLAPTTAINPGSIVAVSSAKIDPAPTTTVVVASTTIDPAPTTNRPSAPT
ncbi:unnamed protein product [Cuscuta campestris]|uniref:Uncharacterized protein n=1 Tax=Cuscuta campestris TaxID=132261 RepID=A0A484N2A4_9ASTE|nr:unnamed protein product [Cuscuta campestris]